VAPTPETLSLNARPNRAQQLLDLESERLLQAKNDDCPLGRDRDRLVTVEQK